MDMRQKQFKNEHKARMKAINEALAKEVAMLNDAIGNGAEVYLKTHAGPFKLLTVTRDLWYITDGNGGYGLSWCGCNDGTWANLLSQAGVERQFEEWKR